MKDSDVAVFYVKVKPNARKECITINGNVLDVKVSVSPVEGKANERLLRLLSDYFHVPKSAIRILRGETSRNKVLEIKGVKV